MRSKTLYEAVKYLASQWKEEWENGAGLIPRKMAAQDLFNILTFFPEREFDNNRTEIWEPTRKRNCHICQQELERIEGYWVCATHGRREDVE